MMHLKLFTPKQSLNKAYLKEKISRTDIEVFKTHFNALIEKINDKGDEEHLKSLIADFLKLTYYNASQHQINPIGKNDLVIHTGKSPSDPYGVILEVKSPGNTSEMISASKPNAKAIHELVLYYLEERITHNRNELKQLVVTNIYDWFIIDANEFDKKIYRNTAVKKLYDLKKSDNKDNPWFYDELKKLFNANADFSIDCTFFDLRDYKKIATNKKAEDDKALIALFKILSPVHLLKLPFANDSNTLQPKFYSELLHIIGLYEYKEGSKKLISRKKEGERNKGSLLENTIVQLDSHDKISRLDKPSQYGDTYQDKLYNVALELVITWINRILFLKLLEAQLINYHKGDRSYTFLTKDKLRDFDDLDKLFFRVLAKRPDERADDIQQLFDKVPYLNSSLFEPTELEHQAIFINGLEDFVDLPLIGTTVLKDDKGKQLKGSLDTLSYLFAFLSAYDFSSEGAEEIQEDNKQLINASVLGLIFEKINGYKDGSFFTPGFITMYMCRETIRRAVVQKFNEAKGWDCKAYEELYDKIADKKEANSIINSLKICDPAVGSGHFLVSALNEIIAIKSDLQILIDNDGRTLRDYAIEVENDELIITDSDGGIFEYSPNSKESQRVQETLFHEKQTIIERCLFGVDINPNSVKICRLRLWIELLKNAYYRAGTRELETLPNIDINIKVGNSLISRFALDADLKQALKKSRFSINAYKIAVQTYREAANKEEKREMERLITAIKSDFRTEISANDPKIKQLDRKSNELYNKYQADKLFNERLTKAQVKDRKKLEEEVSRLSTEIADIKNNRIYENAFEWRFEFPEVLNDDGDFVGFDVVIGNPPYIFTRGNDFDRIKDVIWKNYQLSQGKINLYSVFLELALYHLLKSNGIMSYITPETFIRTSTYKDLRRSLLIDFSFEEFVIYGMGVFEDVTAETITYILSKTKPENSAEIAFKNHKSDGSIFENKVAQATFLSTPEFRIVYDFSSTDESIFDKLKKNSISLGDIVDVRNGVATKSGKNNFISRTKINSNYKKLLEASEISRYGFNWTGNYINYDKEALHRPRKEETFLSKKILIQRVSPKLVCCYDDEQFYTFNSINNIVLKDNQYNLKYILALLNSKLINYYYLKRFSLGANFTITVTKENLDALPIKVASSNIVHEIVDLVDEILILKKANQSTIGIENDINDIVYEIYGLTDDEIKIIESDV